ncbi:MAG: hypothetical protein IT368_13240 [Candidatus Hydrogenedentes bacterium]|nr:hypothetical protein [Candidatus Hydrogenedentota bacterium]
MGWVYDVTFGKQEKADPRRSVPGCLIATAGMVVATIAFLYLSEHFIDRPLERMNKAEDEIAAAEAALQALLKDAGVPAMTELFTEVPLDEESLLHTVELQSAAAYDLLRFGKGANQPLKDAVREKLQDSYLELSGDPWGNNYRFFFGPWPANAPWDFESMPFRAYAKGTPDALTVSLDDGTQAGFPAPADKSIYIFSLGRNEQINQRFNPH